MTFGPAQDTACAFVLREQPERTTRLLVRERYWVHTAVGPVAGRARCGGRLGDDANGYYGHLAEQLVAARRLGLDVGAWVVFGIGAKAMARCCAKLGVTRVVLPATAARPSLRERLFGHTLAAFTARLPQVEFVLVPACGGVGSDR